jgi:hypothetical protein
VKTAPDPDVILRRNQSAVQLNQMPHDRESESEPAMRARSRAICLSKAFKHVWQKLGAMPGPVSRTSISA